MNKTSIEWTDSTWSPLRVRVREDAADIARAKGYTSLVEIAEKMAGRVGPHCEHVSPECEHCYAGTNNHRRLPGNGTGLPYDRRSRDLVEAFVDEKILLEPLRSKTPQRIFAENQSDLFGEWYTDAMLDRVFAVMALCPQHTFQILTKRPEREYVTGDWYFRVSERIYREIHDGRWFGKEAHQRAERRANTANRILRDEKILPNVWLGVSVGTPQHKDRIDILRETPAACRFLSLEPLLADLGTLDLRGIGWVIVGGESGAGARPMEFEWAESIVDQCGAAGVACFVKQMGSGLAKRYGWKSAKGGDWHEWPTRLMVREFPEAL